MKRFVKVLGYCLIAGFFSVALSGCAAKTTTTKAPLVIWSFENEDVWKDIIRDFQSDNKGVAITYQKQTLDSNYENRVLSSILSGQGPDVWAMPSDSVYRHKGQLAPMPDKLAKTVNMDSAYYPAVKTSVVFNNKIYALTPSTEPLIIYYNRALISAAENAYAVSHPKATAAETKQVNDLLENMPLTWSAFSDAVKLLTIKDSAGNITQAGAGIGTDSITTSQDILYLLMLQNQTKIISEDLKLATFANPKDSTKGTQYFPGQQALDFYTSFADPKNAAYVWSDALGNDVDAFGNGKVAMIFGYDSLQNYLTQKFPGFEYKKAAVPQLNRETNTFVDYARFNAFGVSRLSTDTANSWSLVHFLATTEADTFNSATHLYTAARPTDLTVAADDRITSSPERVEMATAQTFVKGRYPVEMDTLLKNAIFAVNKSVLTSKQALETAADKVTEYLKKTTW